MSTSHDLPIHHSTSSRAIAWRVLWFAATVFLSAFLVFQVQPVISKMILPWFGGTPAVWTTCVLFFQLVLFAGYAYAHLVTRYLSAGWQAVVHIGLLALALASLPISPDASWKPEGESSPTASIMWLLAANVGLPYFLLSTTGPLSQAWFSRACTGRSPYRLYALSNIGSLAALVSYPFLFEPLMSTGRQDALWSFGFSLFALACTVLALQARRFPKLASANAATGAASLEMAGSESTGRKSPPSDAALGSASACEEQDDETPDFVQKVGWLLLPAFASMTLLAVTNHLCQDVAVVPFLWVLPLALYLITFIICFDRESWYSRRWCGAGALGSIGLLSFLLVDDSFTQLLLNQGIDFPVNDYTNHLAWDATAYLSTMFFLCMICHGELVRSKPGPEQLTSFYMLCGAGGAVGGVFVGILCPLLFSTYLEMQIAIVAGGLLAALIVWVDACDTYLRQRETWQRVLRVTAIAVCFVLFRVQMASVYYGSLSTLRNFYGVLRVDDYADANGKSEARKLIHGSTIHGFQFLGPGRRQIPTTYYSRQSGVGLSIQRFQQDGPIRVGVIGLGCGTLAAYGRQEDYFRFYEINPLVCDVARKQFTYLSDCPSQVDIIVGDARLSLDREADQAFDVLVLDAFTSDAIPAHLLTREAFAIYERHLKPTGVIAVHTSNRHLKLPPVVARLGRACRMEDAYVFNRDDRDTHTLASQWMLLTHNRQFFRDAAMLPNLRQVQDSMAGVPLWTDQFNNLFQILRL